MNVKSCFIRKRGQRYCVVVEYLDNETGIYKQKIDESFILKKEAENHLIEVRYNINNNKYKKPTDMTFVERCILYVENAKNRIEYSTLINYNSYIKNHVKPYFNDFKLVDITPTYLQTFVDYIYNKHTKGCASQYVTFTMVVLKEAFRLNEIPNNVCDYVKRPVINSNGYYKLSKGETVYRNDINLYIEEEAKFVLKKIHTSVVELPVTLILILGLRKTEATGLAWNCIDFENNKIVIKRRLVYENYNGFVFGPTKNKKRRALKAPKYLMDLLKNEKIRQNKLKLNGLLKNELNLVCLNSALKPFHPSSVNDAYKSFCKKNNIREIKVHDLRHTNASILVASGTNFKTISERLGHSDIKITLNRYSHLLDSMDEEANNNLENILFK
ncbi:site-specific integrase [Metaclostridioides mangenotii]|uniref:site-specific integrase n=1 Tax=Metaclostridioides mangenotii TaxID=1540 RepID=UPI0028E9C320|nr:site-specific integrase [Clostridioides mangenotii]